MPLAGQAFLALWNDIERAREAEYDQWHTLEHVPERVAVTGFRGARRYVDRGRAHHRYFTLYDVDTPATFDSAEYRDLVDHPTPWSASMRPDFRNFLRAVCTVTSSRGTGIGAAIACLCVSPATPESALREALAASESGPRVNAVHLGRRHASAAPAAFGAASEGVRDFDRVALIEALDRAAAVDALAGVQRVLGLTGLPRDFGADVYDLAFVFPGADSAERLRHRRPGWPS